MSLRGTISLCSCIKVNQIHLLLKQFSYPPSGQLAYCPASESFAMATNFGFSPVRTQI